METQQKMMHLRHKRTQKPCQQERTKQQWKDFTQNFQECNKKSNVSMRLHQRENQRNSHSCQKIGQQRIGRQAGCASTSLPVMTAAAVAVGQMRQTIDTFKHFPVDLLHRQHTNNTATIKQETVWNSSNHPCHDLGFSSCTSTLQKVSRSWEKIKSGVRKATNPFT